jgi:hypothetical protein
MVGDNGELSERFFAGNAVDRRHQNDIGERRIDANARRSYSKDIAL